MSKITILLGILVAVAFFAEHYLGKSNSTLSDIASEKELAKSRPFREAFIEQKPSLNLLRLLVGKSCGMFWFKTYTADSEFIVKCSSDGKAFHYYVVWPNIQKIMGPYKDDPTGVI